MGNLRVRLYDPNDWQAFAHVRSQVWRGGAPVLAGEKLIRDDSTVVVVEQDGKVAGSATLLKMTCTTDAGELPCAGWASVGVLPECRQSGVGSALMSESIEIAKDLGFEIGSLYPFRESWYRRFGFVTAGLRYAIKCPADRLPTFRSELEVRQVSESELGPVHVGMLEQYSGFSRRQPDQWWRALGGDTPKPAYVAGDPAEAYAILEWPPGFWEWLRVKEFAWTTERGYRSILAFLRKCCLNQAGVEWYEPVDGPFMREYSDSGVEASLERPIMYRLLAGTADESRHLFDRQSKTTYCLDFF